jgi:hypothetical protein
MNRAGSAPAQARCPVSGPTNSRAGSIRSSSGPCQWQFYPSLTATEQRGVEVAAELGCTAPDPAPCLRSLPASAILAKEQGATTDTAGLNRRGVVELFRYRCERPWRRVDSQGSR